MTEGDYRAPNNVFATPKPSVYQAATFLLPAQRRTLRSTTKVSFLYVDLVLEFNRRKIPSENSHVLMGSSWRRGKVELKAQVEGQERHKELKELNSAASTLHMPSALPQIQK